MANIYQTASDLVGRTPLLQLNHLEKELNLYATLLAKLEYFNPTGSAKDRAALFMLDEGEKSGLIDKDTVIIEPTSGNTGIGLASVCTSRGYKAVIVMPETMSEERKALMRLYGAELVLTDGAQGMAGAIKKAEELKKQYPKAFIPNQFENEANAKAHFETTGPEIWDDTEGKVDVFVAGVGTGGTITGVGRFLKSKNENIKVIAVEPKDSPVLSEGRSGAHKIQGIGAGFVPKVLDVEIYDSVFTVTTEEAINSLKALGSLEGILTGISSGAALFAGIETALKDENKDKNIVVLLPDTGDRYLSVL
jgi:cysteine synthase A